MAVIRTEDFVLYTDNDDWIDSFADDQSTQEDESDECFGQDWRIGLMSTSMQALIYARFGGSVDLAMLHADKLVHTYRNPPQWAVDLHDIRKTQLDLATRRTH